MNTKTCFLILGSAAWISSVAAVAPAWAASAASDAIQLSRSAREADRIQAADLLAAPGAEVAEAVAALTPLLQDASAAVRARAARSLGEIGSPAAAAAPGLIALLGDADGKVRSQVVKALAAIRPGPKVMLPALLKLLEDSDPGVRLCVLNAVAEAGEAAVPGLIRALKNDRATFWACLILREMGPAAGDAAPALAEELEDARPEIRREALLALGTMQEAATPFLPQIAALLNDEHTRGAATFVLGQLGNIPAEAAETVRKNAESDDRFLRTVSLWALARVHPEDKDLRRRAEGQIVERLKDAEPMVRAAAARALAALPPEPEITLPILRKALQDADAGTVQHAIDALAALGAPAVPMLIEILEREKGLRIEAASALGHIGPSAAAATDALAKGLADEDASVVAELALALAKIGPAAQGAVGALTAALPRENGSNAPAILFALGRIGPPAASASPKLLEIMRGENRTAAVVAAWAYVQTQSGSAESAALAVPVLIAGLSDPLPETRRAASEALGNLGSLAREAVPALKKAAVDADDAVSEAASKALRSIGEAKPRRD